MADLTLPSPVIPHLKEILNANPKQTRMELQQEVCMLHKMLENEEKVNQVLECALLSRTTGSTLQVPSFLPKEVKELLAELVMVEEEISRLEIEINKFQDDWHDTEEGQAKDAMESLKNKRTNQSVVEPLGHSTATPILPLEGKAMQDKLAMEIKPMFFINQAIKGDYKIYGLNTMEKTKNLTGKTNKREWQGPMEYQERVPMKSEILDRPKRSGIVEKQPSSKLPPRNLSPKQIKANAGISSSFARESSTITTFLVKNGQKWQPNKLSEKIMKCLICIFLRITRTSQAIELEKSGNLSRSANLLLKTGSFKAHNSLNLRECLDTHRKTGKQDPYGIFEIENSLVRDIGPYRNLVRFTLGSLDAKGSSKSLPLVNQLRDLLIHLHGVDLRFLSHQQKLAFWINIYNACIMHGFLQHGFPRNPQNMPELRSKAVLNIFGNKLNALAIEQFILRQPSNIKEASNGDKDDKEYNIRNLYGLEHEEPNISFALCCGYRSSPAVKIYTADSISTELEKSKSDYLQASIVVSASKRIMIPKLLLLNMHDFADDLSSLVNWICHQLPTSGSLRKSISECLKGYNKEDIPDIVDILPQDFIFQYLLPMW